MRPRCVPCLEKAVALECEIRGVMCAFKIHITPLCGSKKIDVNILWREAASLLSPPNPQLVRQRVACGPNSFLY